MRPRKNENTLNENIFIEVFNDKSGDLLFTAIKSNDLLRLKELIIHQADIGLLKNGINCMQYAARLGKWECANTILVYGQKYIDTFFNRDIDYYKKVKFGQTIGEVLLLAIKADQQKIVDILFNWINEKKYTAIIGPYGKKTGFVSDPENGYTALHWAVKNNNPAACNHFVRYTKLFLPILGQHHFSYENHLFRQQDNNHENPLDLAISLNHTDCIKEIAKGMSFLGIVRFISYSSLCKMLFSDTRLEFKEKKYEGNSSFSSSSDVYGRILKFQKLMHIDILQLPVTERNKTVSLLLNPDTLLSLFYTYWTDSKGRNKYKTRLTDTLSPNFQDNQKHSNKYDYVSSSKVSQFFFSQKTTHTETIALLPHITKKADRSAKVFGRDMVYESISSTSEVWDESSEEKNINSQNSLNLSLR